MRLKNMLCMVLMVLCLIGFAVSGHAADSPLPEKVTVGGQELVLNGKALRKVFIIKVYWGGLYLPEQRSTREAIFAKDEPRMMTMHFLRDVDAEKVAGGWHKGLTRNIPNPSPELVQHFEELGRYMEDLVEGDEMQFAYTPEQGTAIIVKGQQRVVIPTKAFADAILATWIGTDPGPGEDFRDGILGQE